MTELTATVRESGKAPNFKKTAAELLQRCREFYQDPENERAYQEWKARKEEKHEKAAV
jgi:hypothetical protein